MARRSVVINIRDVKGLERALKGAMAEVVSSVRDQMKPAGSALLSASNTAADAPRDTGGLLASGLVLEPVGGAVRANVTVAYTHPLAPAVHEGFHGGKKRAKGKTPTRGWFTRALFGYESGFRTFIVGALQKALR